MSKNIRAKGTSFESSVPINQKNVEACVSDCGEPVRVPTWWERWGSDVWRVIPMIAIPVVLLKADEGTLYVLSYVIAVTLLFSFTTHLTRKILFPYLDLAAFARKAFESPLGAAIVFAAILLLLSTIFYSSVAMMR